MENISCVCEIYNLCLLYIYHSFNTYYLSPPSLPPSLPSCTFALLSNRPDSPGVPVSATSREVFRGFSYVDPTLLDEERRTTSISHTHQNTSSTLHMSTVSARIWRREGGGTGEG